MSSKNWSYLGLLVTFFLSGVFSQLYFPDSPFPPTAVLFGLIGGFFMFVWYRADAKQRQLKPSKGLSIGIIAIGLVAFPYYLFKTRGPKGGLIATLVFLVALFLSSYVDYVGRYAAWSAFQQ